VVARRLAENLEVSALLLEADGSNDMPSIMETGQWFLHIVSERDWATAIGRVMLQQVPDRCLPRLQL
jgi:hypothetical protein